MRINPDRSNFKRDSPIVPAVCPPVPKDFSCEPIYAYNRMNLAASLVSNSQQYGECAPVMGLKEARKHTDVVLVDQCQAGDPEAFDELVRRYKDRIYLIVFRFLGNHEDALDVAQEVFVRAYRGIHSFHGHAQVYTWLYSIAANLARNRLRDQSRKGRNQGISLDGMNEAAGDRGQTAVAGQDNPRDAAQHRELQDALQGCLGQLPDTYRMAFVLRVSDGLCYEEIALSLGCPAGTVKSRLNQARKLLRDCLKLRGVL